MRYRVYVPVWPDKGHVDMTLSPQMHSRSKIKNLPFAGLVVAVALSLAMLVQLAVQVVDTLDALRTTNLDSIHWTVTQLEIEQAALTDAATEAEDHPSPKTFETLRLRYDVLYSRLSLILESPLYRQMIIEAGTFDDVMGLFEAIKEFEHIVDDSDLVLGQSLDRLAPFLVGARPLMRDISNRTNQRYAVVTGLARERLYLLLRQLGMVTVTLFGTMTALGFLLRRQLIETQKTSARLEALIQTAPEPVIVTDRSGQITLSNKAARLLFNGNDDGLGGARIGDWVGTAADGAPFVPHLFGQRAHAIDVQASGADGVVRPMQLSIGQSRTGHDVAHVIFLHDMTDTVAAQAELTRSRDLALAGEKAKSEFLAVMSHEMRTPLNGILGAAELLPDTKTKKEKDALVGVIETSGKALLRHVNDVLDISQMETGDFALCDAPTDIDLLLQSLGKVFAATKPTQEGRVTIAAPNPPLGWFVTDAQRLSQALGNLLELACGVTQAGKITLTAQEQTSTGNGQYRVTFIVQSTGAVTDPGFVERVNAASLQLRQDWDRSTISVAITQRIVEAMGGTFTAAETAEGGASFAISLPLMQIKAVTSAKPETFDFATSQVLVVDDNDINRFIMRSMLEREGAVVVEAENGQQAVEATQEHDFDLILMDINMPVMDGVEATKAIRRGQTANSGTRIIAVTAHVFDNEIAQYREAGLDHVMAKPISSEMLRTIIASAPLARIVRDDQPSLAPVDHAHLDAMQRSLGQSVFQAMLQRYIEDTNRLLSQLSNLTSEVAEHSTQAKRLAELSAAYGIPTMQLHFKDIEAQIETGLGSAEKPFGQTVFEGWANVEKQLLQYVSPNV